MAPREGIPKSHVDRRDRDADEPLGTKESESPGEVLLDLERRERLAPYEIFQIPDQLSGRFERRHGIGANDAMADGALIAENIGEHQG